MNQSQGIWKSPEGKLIPYIKEVSQTPLPFDTDDFSNYFLLITKWPKNTSISILEIFSSFDVKDICIEETIHHFCKLSHNEFEARKDELIAQAIALADKKFNQNQPNHYH